MLFVMRLLCALFVLHTVTGIVSVSAAETPKRVPQFEDYPVAERWHGRAAKPLLNTREKRMFKTQITDAAHSEADFAGRFKLAIWGCGSNCSSGAIINLSDGVVYGPALTDYAEGHWLTCMGVWSDPVYDYRINSRLMIVRCGVDYDGIKDGKNRPDVFYLLWEGTRFRELLHVSPKTAGKPDVH